MEEVWKDIKGYEGKYQVSDLGRVKSLHYGKERILKVIQNTDGYLFVNLCKCNKYKQNLIHRLVAQAFISNPDNLPQVNHKDENPLNNVVSNLEWCDAKYNINYGTRTARTMKNVYQYTLDGTLVASYPSTVEVKRQTGYSQGNISDCCNGKHKTMYGFIWSYTLL